MIIVSALSLSLRDKERFRDWEIERAWQLSPLNVKDDKPINDKCQLSGSNVKVK